MLVVYFSGMVGRKIEFSKFVNFRKKVEILTKIKVSIFMKMGYAQKLMTVESWAKYRSYRMFTFKEWLLTKMESQNVWFSEKKKIFCPNSTFKLSNCLTSGLFLSPKGTGQHCSVHWLSKSDWLPGVGCSELPTPPLMPSSSRPGFLVWSWWFSQR